MRKTTRIIGLITALSVAFTPVVASAAVSRSERSPTFLDMFAPSQLQCGRKGWTFPVLLNGHKPITACMLRAKQAANSPFGPL
jgi:hypothetical protein